MMKIVTKISHMPATLCLIIIWIAVWLLAVTQNIAPAVCGKGALEIRGEYYRYFTAGLIHQNLIHLAVNCLAMFWIGYLYESQLGSVRFVLTGVFCAAAAQVAFSYIFPNVQSSVGGSCYNYALCGFSVVCAFLIPGFPQLKLGTWSGNWIVVYLIGANIPFLPFMDWTTFVIHGIAFALGATAAFLCWFFGC